MIQKFQFIIYPQETDFTGQITLCAIGNHILNAAGLAAEELNFGIKKVQAENLTWVLSRLVIEMKRYPLQNELITVDTWIEDCNKLTSARNFKLYDAEHNIIGYACVLWAIIDMTTRRPINLQEKTELQKYIIPESLPIERPVRIDEIPSEAIGVKHIVKYSDIDFNGHTNSMKYIEWMINCIPLEVFRGRYIQRCEVNYVHEVVYNEEVIIYCSEEPTEMLTVFDVKSTNGKSCCKAKFLWQRP